MLIQLDKYGNAISDHLCKDVLLNQQRNEIHTSTNNVIACLRYLVLKGKINCNHVTIIIDGKNLHMNQYGNIVGKDSHLESLDWNLDLNIEVLKMQAKN
jgi:hypothetical protein